MSYRRITFSRVTVRTGTRVVPGGLKGVENSPDVSRPKVFCRRKDRRQSCRQHLKDGTPSIEVTDPVYTSFPFVSSGRSSFDSLTVTEGEGRIDTHSVSFGGREGTVPRHTPGD